MALLWGRAVHPRALAGVAAAGGGLARACTNSSLVVENVVTRGSTRQRDLARSAFRQGRSAFETASYAAVDFRVEAVRSMVRSMSSKSASGREDQSSSATPGQRDQGEEVPEGKVGFRRPAQNPPIKTALGGLVNLIYVPQADEMVMRAEKAAALIVPDSKISAGMATKRAQKFTTQSISKFSDSLTVPLGEIVKAFENVKRGLHPFEIVIANLVMTTRVKRGDKKVEEVLKHVKELRKLTSQRAQEGSHAGASAANRGAAEQIRVKTISDIKYIWYQKSDVLDRLADVARELRKVPALDLNMPIAVLVGCPNVGKSSIVRMVSSGTPEIANYPFTTRSMTMGHVVDTPGVLARDASQHNHMELLTVAAVEHLPSVVVFVMDLSGAAGEKSTTAAQMQVRQYLKERFPKSPWIDVVSKVDMPIDKEQIAGIDVPDGAIHVSCITGSGAPLLIAKLKEAVLRREEQRLPGLECQADDEFA